MKPRSVVIAMAVAAGFTAGLTGCTPIPDYTYVTVTSANPWMPGTRTMWVVQGTAVERTETFPDDGVEASSTLNYQLLDQQAFLKAVHRALDLLDEDALAAAQTRLDALAAQRIIQDALLTSMAADR